LHTYHTPLDLVRERSPDRPVAIVRRDAVALAARWFQDNFKGDVLYAVKANPSPWVIETLAANGVRGFDVASIPEIELVKAHAPFGLPLSADQWLYFFCLAWAALLFWAASNLVRGRIGRAIVAIRDHPVAAEAMGVNTSFYKAMCFGVSALYAGVAGALGAVAVGFVSPDSFELFLSLSFLVGIVVGGLASISGVLFGALFIEFVPNYADQLSNLFGESAKALPGAIYGALLIALMYAMPAGVAGVIGAAARRLSRAKPL